MPLNKENALTLTRLKNRALKVREWADETGRTRQTVYNWIKEGFLVDRTPERRSNKLYMVNLQGIAPPKEVPVTNKILFENVSRAIVDKMYHLTINDEVPFDFVKRLKSADTKEQLEKLDKDTQSAIILIHYKMALLSEQELQTLE